MPAANNGSNVDVYKLHMIYSTTAMINI